jgi:hypothetical protein
MEITQVSVIIELPKESSEDFPEEMRATINYSPGKPGSTHVWLPKSDLSLEQLQIVGDFVNRLSRFGDRAAELVKTIMEMK